jgi:hypothetical protein
MNLMEQLTLQLTQDNIMAHFAEIDEETYQVLNILVVPDEQEHRGQDYLADDCRLGGVWIQTSYNTRGGVHYKPNSFEPSGKSALRKNYAIIGGYYDSIADVFYAQKPIDNPSFVLNLDTYLWEPPVPLPNKLPQGLDPSNNYTYIWNENEINWELVSSPKVLNLKLELGPKRPEFININ